VKVKARAKARASDRPVVPAPERNDGVT
jgi:hypothetical protein